METPGWLRERTGIWVIAGGIVVPLVLLPVFFRGGDLGAFGILTIVLASLSVLTSVGLLALRIRGSRLGNAVYGLAAYLGVGVVYTGIRLVAVTAGDASQPDLWAPFFWPAIAVADGGCALDLWACLKAGG